MDKSIFVFLRFHLDGSASFFVGSDHVNIQSKVYQSRNIDKITNLARRTAKDKNLSIVEETESSDCLFN